MKKLITISIILCLILVGCNIPNKAVEKEKTLNQNNNHKENKTIEETVIKKSPEVLILEKMSTEEKLGQLIITGIETIELTELEKETIKERFLGGVIFFQRNIKTEQGTRSLIESINKINKSKLSMFIAIDEEGGAVSRTKGIYKNLPPISTLGEIQDTNKSKEYGRILGSKLYSLGFNVNFAPVLDINSNKDNPVIGNRSISSNVELVNVHSIPIIKGLQEYGIIAVGKHFPGHGDTLIDSHKSIPTINKTKIELENLELIPFKNAIENGVDGIMVGHLFVPSIDNKITSLSKKAITDLLRKELGFSGLVFSDDMTMGALIESTTIEQGALDFINAGGDVLLICHGLENTNKVLDYLTQALKENKLSEQRLNESVMKIIKAKLELKKLDIPRQTIIEINDRVKRYN